MEEQLVKVRLYKEHDKIEALHVFEGEGARPMMEAVNFIRDLWLLSSNSFTKAEIVVGDTVQATLYVH